LHEEGEIIACRRRRKARDRLRLAKSCNCGPPRPCCRICFVGDGRNATDELVPGLDVVQIIDAAPWASRPISSSRASLISRVKARAVPPICTTSGMTFSASGLPA
jgi:hypothetical protein